MIIGFSQGVVNRMLSQKTMATVPMIFMVIGFILMMAGVGATLIPLSGVSFGTGPVSVSVFGISAFSATLIFSGLVFLVMGMLSLSRMAKKH